MRHFQKGDTLKICFFAEAKQTRKIDVNDWKALQAAVKPQTITEVSFVHTGPTVDLLVHVNPIQDNKIWLYDNTYEDARLSRKPFTDSYKLGLGDSLTAKTVLERLQSLQNRPLSCLTIHHEGPELFALADDVVDWIATAKPLIVALEKCNLTAQQITRLNKITDSSYLLSNDCLIQIPHPKEGGIFLSREVLKTKRRDLALDGAIQAAVLHGCTKVTLEIDFIKEFDAKLLQALKTLNPSTLLISHLETAKEEEGSEIEKLLKDKLPKVNISIEKRKNAL